MMQWLTFDVADPITKTKSTIQGVYVGPNPWRQQLDEQLPFTMAVQSPGEQPNFGKPHHFQAASIVAGSIKDGGPYTGPYVARDEPKPQPDDAEPETPAPEMTEEQPEDAEPTEETRPDDADPGEPEEEEKADDQVTD